MNMDSVFIVRRRAERGEADDQIVAAYVDQDLAERHCAADPSCRFDEEPIPRRLPPPLRGIREERHVP